MRDVMLPLDLPEVPPSNSDKALPIKLDFHPIAAIFPMMSDAEIADLAEDIRAHGLHEPIILHRNGKILDGRNRYRACEIVGIKPNYETYAGDDPVAYVVSLNLRRRHLNESQRAMVAANISNLERGRPSEKLQGSVSPEKKPADPQVSVPQAAQMLNVAERTVRLARSVQREAAPNIVNAIEQGSVRIEAAAKAIKAAPKEEQETWTVSDIRRVAKEIALDGVKLPTPKQAEALSKEQGGAYIVGSDGKYHVHLTDEQKQLKEDWFAFKERLFGWVDLAVTPERALAAIPPYQRKNVEQELVAARDWLNRFEKLWSTQENV